VTAKREAPPEKTITSNVMAMAKRLGWLAVKMHGGSYSLRGFPDVQVIKEGRSAFMEVKRPGEHPTRAQEHRMRELAKAGCPVCVVFSAQDARHFLEAIDGQ
jgi:hypothetical protein